MTTRRERVVLELEDNFTRGMIEAAGATALLNRELNSLSGSAVRGASRDLDSAAKDVDKVGKSSSSTSKEVDKLSGRMRILADTAAILGPALVPIGAMAIPAMAGLANGFAAVALAGGTAVLAFQGIGDTLDAVNTAALEPTAQNMEKARFALEQLSPAAQGFVLELQRMRPALEDLQGAAASGLFPGLTDAITALQSRLPDVEVILTRMGETLGNLARNAGEALAGPEWDSFMSFISVEAPQALAAFGQSVGSLTHGMAQLWMAMTPLNHDFSDVMVRAAASFDQWASGLSKTQGFHEFIDYLRQQGPLVADALAAIGDAVLQIVEAAAPLGGPVLQALTGVARAIAAIADSNAGPAIMATVTALAILNRSMAAFNAISDKPWVKAARGADTLTGKLAASRGALIRGGAAMAGLGIAASGLGDKFGLANTASLALMGTIAGPWGAAVGAGVGLMMDLGKSHDYTSASSQDLQGTLNAETGAITQNTRAYAANALEKSGALQAAQALGLSLPDVTSAALGNADALDRVNAGLDAAKAGFYDTDGRVMVSSNTLQDYQGNLEKVSGGIGDVSGKLDDAKSRQIRYAAATGEASSATRGETSALQSNVAAFNRKIQALGAAFDAETNYRQALKDARKQAESNTQGIRGNSDAVIANRQKLSGLRDAWNQQSEAVRNNTSRYAQARADFISVARQMGVNAAQAQHLADKYLAIPNNIKTTVTAITGQALAALGEARRQLDSLNGRVANMYIHVTRSGPGGTTNPGGTFHYASGGEVRGPGGPREDKIPAWLSNGEFVVNAAATARNLNLLRHINAQGFAEGGGYGLPASRSFNVQTDGVDALNRTASQLAATQKKQNDAEKSHLEHMKHALDTRKKLLEKELERDQHEVDRDKKRHDAMVQELQDLKQQRQQLMAQTKSQFTTDIFGQGGVDLAQYASQHGFGGNFGNNVYAFAQKQMQESGQTGAYNFNDWVQQYLDSLSPDKLAALQVKAGLGTLNQDASNADAFEQALKKAKRHGLSGGLLHYLEASGNLQAAQQFANMSASQISQYEKAYKNRNYELNQTAQMVGNDKYGAAIKAQTKAAEQSARVLSEAKAEWKETNHSLHRLEKRMSALEHAASKTGPDRTAHGVANAINNAVSHGQRSGK